MQLDLIIDQEDFSDEKVLLGLSAGINSAAVLCWLAKYPEHLKPKELHIFYAHLQEHSPDSYPFVRDLIRFARGNFKNVFVKITRNSVLRFFEEQKMIPHPKLSPCTRLLKLLPMHEYMALNGIKTDLVGYVREEAKRRVKNVAKKTKQSVKNRSLIVDGVKKHYIISDKYNEWCFDIVRQSIGWYPEIYDIKINGKRVFTHNNCLPCKNYNEQEFVNVEVYYPEYYSDAQKTSEKLDQYWGRRETSFYTTFGRTEDELKSEPGCEICLFD